MNRVGVYSHACSHSTSPAAASQALRGYARVPASHRRHSHFSQTETQHYNFESSQARLVTRVRMRAPSVLDCLNGKEADAAEAERNRAIPRRMGALRARHDRHWQREAYSSDDEEEAGKAPAACKALTQRSQNLRNVSGLGSGVISPPIGETLPDNPLERFSGALAILNPKRRALVVSEIEFGQIALQVLLADVVIRPRNAALKDREVAFDRIGVGIAPDVFADTVVDRLMAGEIRPENTVLPLAISHKRRASVKLRGQDRAQGRGRHFRDMVRADLAATLDKRESDLLARAADVSLLALPSVLILLLPADIGLVCFDRLSRAAHRRGVDIAHRLTDAVRHEPSRLVRNGQHAVQLVARNAFLAGAHEERCVQPLMQRHMRALKDGAHCYRELLAAGIAHVKAVAVRALLAANQRCLVNRAAMGADRAGRPKMGFQPLTGFGFVLENLVLHHVRHHSTMTPCYQR
jgi:hypothetical protein